jgi:hypothetical protein
LIAESIRSIVDIHDRPRPSGGHGIFCHKRPFLLVNISAAHKWLLDPASVGQNEVIWIYRMHNVSVLFGVKIAKYDISERARQCRACARRSGDSLKRASSVLLISGLVASACSNKSTNCLLAAVTALRNECVDIAFRMRAREILMSDRLNQ